MSLRTYYDSTSSSFNLNTIENKLIITNGSSQIHLKYDPSGNFDITNASDNTDLISFDSGKHLTSNCALYSHIGAITDPVISQVSNHTTTLASHASTIADHDTRLDNIEGGSSGLQALNSVLAVGSNANNLPITNLQSLQVNGNVTSANITTMQNVVNSHQTAIELLQNRCTALESYNTELKKLILSISESLVLKDPSNPSSEFSYSVLLN